MPPVNVIGDPNVVHVDPFRYWREAVPPVGAGSTVTVAPAGVPAGSDALSGVPVTVGGVIVTVNVFDTVDPYRNLYVKVEDPGFHVT